MAWGGLKNDSLRHSELDSSPSSSEEGLGVVAILQVSLAKRSLRGEATTPNPLL